MGTMVGNADSKIPIYLSKTDNLIDRIECVTTGDAMQMQVNSELLHRLLKDYRVLIRDPYSLVIGEVDW